MSENAREEVATRIRFHLVAFCWQRALFWMQERIYIYFESVLDEIDIWHALSRGIVAMLRSCLHLHAYTYKSSRCLHSECTYTMNINGAQFYLTPPPTTTTKAKEDEDEAMINELLRQRDALANRYEDTEEKCKALTIQLETMRAQVRENGKIKGVSFTAFKAEAIFNDTSRIRQIM